MVNTPIIFAISVLDQERQQREFLYQLDRIEVGFDVLSTIVAQGSTLLKATLVQDGTVTRLPLDAFDGTSCVETIQALEQQWQQALDQVSGSASRFSEEYLHLTCQRVYWYQAHLINLDELCSRTEGLLQQAYDLMVDGPRKDRLVSRYTALIDTYQTSMVRINSLLEKALDRLKGQYEVSRPTSF